MKTLALFLAVTIAVVIAGCSDTPNSPVTPADEVTAASNASPGLEKNGPIVHSVQGGFWFDDYGNGKTVPNTIGAHQYADGSVNGMYLINSSNAFGHDKWNKWNARVIFIKVYDNVPGYEKFAVVGGVETTGPGKGYFEVWWLAVNGPGGEDYTADAFFYDMDSSVVAAIWNLPPVEMLLVPGLTPSLPIDGGSLSIK